MEAVKIIILCLLSAVLLVECAFSPQWKQEPMKTEFLRWTHMFFYGLR